MRIKKLLSWKKSSFRTTKHNSSPSIIFYVISVFLNPQAPQIHSTRTGKNASEEVKGSNSIVRKYLFFVSSVLSHFFFFFFCFSQALSAILAIYIFNCRRLLLNLSSSIEIRIFERKNSFSGKQPISGLTIWILGRGKKDTRIRGVRIEDGENEKNRIVKKRHTSEREKNKKRHE